MTQKGERLGFPDFGTNLKEIYSITDLDEEKISDIASNEVQDAVNRFMPSVRLVEFYSKRLVSNDSELNFLNLIGSRFISKQNSNVNIDNVDVIEINKNNQFLDSVFKVIIKFNIPAISDKNSQIELFINTGK
jgi:phage baseplate assembly protein W